jgi:phosphoglycolate phosphatase-like HAD superfamily hydrolase
MEYANLVKPEIIALDLDKTVHNVIEIYEQVLNQTREYLGYKILSQLELDNLYKNGYMTVEDTFRIMFGEDCQKALAYYYERIHSLEIEEKHILPGAREMIIHTKKLGLLLVAVTNATQHTSKKILRDLGLFKYFDAVTGMKQTRILKPDPLLLKISLNKINRTPGKNVWFMGDSDTDTECAKISNCTAIRYYLGQEKPEDKNADAFFNCHFEFIEAINYFYGADYKARH